MLNPSLTPVKENCPQLLLNKVHSKRAQWYSPCKNFPKLPLSPEPDPPTLKLTHFAAVPKISFGTVKVGGSKTEPFVVQNPHPLSQTLVIEKFPKDRGFTLDLNGNGMAEDSQGNCISIPANEEIFLSIKWEPRESGSCREVILFKWDNSPRLQVVVFGTALGPKKMKSATKKIVKKSGPTKISERFQGSKKVARAILQPSQIPNTVDSKEKSTKVTHKLDSEKIDCANAPVENSLEENLRRDTYLVTNNGRYKPVCKTSPNTCTPKLTKPATKPFNGKKKKVVVAKKISPVSGALTKKSKHKVKLKVAAKGVAQRKLQLVKTPNNKLPRHPMPFAAKNMYYDERWIEKQEEGFTKWLNFVLTPPDVTDSTVQADASRVHMVGNMVLGGTQETKKSQPLAPTKEALSLRAYTAKRKMARLRRCACLLYQSEPLGYIIRKIEAEVENGRLAIRPDKKLHADLGIKKQVADMILSYNSLWLRIGLETIFGEILPIHSNDDVSGLRRFITDRLLGNPDIASAFAHPQVPGLYREGYVEQLGKFTLKKFLLLVLFLDRAKLTRLIDHDPCLFNKDASFKSNRSLLLTFSREYLKGEGDVTKHLNFLGYSVTHSQRPIDEVDYAVKNIATDLRDGLRLTRVVELLTHDWQLSASLRVPAISRLQKIHNVDLFMNALKQRGILVGGIHGGVTDARHIVDGHREKTLTLLWQMIFHFQVNVLLSEKLLQEEIAHLESTRLLRDQLTAAENWIEGDEAEFVGKRRDSSDLYFQSDRLRLLFKWCKMVCRLYGLKIENFTVSFSDGRALCFLLHHYHPSLLPRSRIKEQTSLTCNPGVHDTSDSEVEEGMAMNSWTAIFSPGCGTNTFLEELKSNERENFRTMAEKVRELGGVPLMTKATDMSYTIPDEKVVITYVAYLCARLLDLREETRAARCIQVAWRRFRLKRRLELKKNVAKIVVFIQACARAAMTRRRFQAMRQSTVLIQSMYRGHLVRRQLRARHQAANCIQTRYLAFKKGREVLEWYRNLRKIVVRLQRTVLANQRKRKERRDRAAKIAQSAWKGFMERRKFVEKREACIRIQAFIRGVILRGRFLLLRNSTVLIQRIFRALMIERKEREHFLHLRKCVIVLQSLYRGKRDRKRVKQIRAVIMIQSHVRAWETRSRFLLLKHAATKIQANARMYQTRKKFALMKSATRTLQVHFRATLLGREEKIKYMNQKSACIKIQSFIRCDLQRKAFLKKRKAAVMIQSIVRMYLARSSYRNLLSSTAKIQRRLREFLYTKSIQQKYVHMKLSALKIQSCYRGYRCRKQFTRVRLATVTLQSLTRRFLGRKKFLALAHAAVVIQTRYRALQQGRHQRVEYHRILDTVVHLQALVRGNIGRKRLVAQHRSATLIQTVYRGYVCRTKYQSSRQAAINIQRRYRSFLLGRHVRSNFQRLQHASVQIQSYFRGFQARKQVNLLRSAMKIQAAYRGYRARKSYNNSRNRIIHAQALTRGYLTRKYYYELKKATVKLQSRYRARVIGMRQYVNYHVQRGACILIQAAVRGYHSRKRYLVMRNAAIVIQQKYKATVECRSQRERYLASRRAAIHLQACVRGWLDRKLARRLRAARLIQATYKMYKTREQFLTFRSAVLRLQAQTRMIKQRQRFISLKNATVVIQRKFRAAVLCKHDQLVFHFIRGAVITLQMAVRGYLVRTRLRKMNDAAVKIQACFRGFRTWRRYEATKRAVLILQLRYRAWLLGRAVARNLNALKSSSLIIQSSYRRYKVRLNLKRKQAAVKIQSAYRCHVCASKYLLQKSSAVVIQAEVRRYIARRSYQNLRRAASVIQRRFRAQREMQVVRRCFTLQRKACAVLQTEIRAWQCRRHYSVIKSAAITIQQHFRACVKSRTQREGFLQLRSATVVFQSYWRMSSARRKYKRAQDAAIKIQAFARMTKEVRAYQKLKNATMALQKIYRANHLCKRQRKSYEMMRRGAIILQSHLRGFIARQRVAEMLMEKQRRGAAALKIQRYYCGYRLMKETHFTYHVTRGAIITLQSAFRMVRAQKFARRLRAVIKIQAAYRTAVTRRNFLAVRESVCRIQATVRRNQTRQQFVATREAIVAIQQWYRAQVAMREIYAEYQCLRRATVLIQSYYKGYCQRKSYLCDRQKVVLVQSSVRMHLQRTKFLQKRSAVIVIQCRYRSFIIGQDVRQRFREMKWAATRIQSFYRGCQARDEVKKLRSAILIQSHARGMIQRQKYYHAKQILIRMQASVKAWHYRKSYLELKAATVFLQRKVRANIASRRASAEFQEVKRAVVTLQSFYRGWKARFFVRQLKAVIQIQRWFRGTMAGRTAREDYRRLKDATVILQAAFRGYRGRMVARKMFAARVIQAAFIGFITRRKIKRQKAQRLVQLKTFAAAAYHHLKAIRIQRCYRRARAIVVAKARMDAVLLIQYWWRGVLQHRRFTTLRSAAVFVQRAARKKLVTKNKNAAKIQSLIRGVLARNHLRKRRACALRIQALWRGYRVRRGVSSVKVKKARKRIKSANAAATESMKLCNRTRSALDFLLQCKNISKIVGALVNLEVVTRLSEVCCQQVVRDGALPVIFKVIKKCNRSLPHLEVIKYSISILFNVAQYPSVYTTVYEQPDSIETLVELLANFRDKSFLFAKTCCLLFVLCRDSSIAQDILNMTKIVEDIKSVHKIAERNHRLEAKRNKVNERSTCQLAPPTPYKGKKFNSVKWQQRLNMVQDPLEAVRLLVKKLGLAPLDE